MVEAPFSTDGHDGAPLHDPRHRQDYLRDNHDDDGGGRNSGREGTRPGRVLGEADTVAPRGSRSDGDNSADGQGQSQKALDHDARVLRQEDDLSGDRQAHREVAALPVHGLPVVAHGCECAGDRRERAQDVGEDSGGAADSWQPRGDDSRRDDNSGDEGPEGARVRAVT